MTWQVSAPFRATQAKSSSTLGSERCSSLGPAPCQEAGAVPCSVQWALVWGLKQLWLQRSAGQGRLSNGVPGQKEAQFSPLVFPSKGRNWLEGKLRRQVALATSFPAAHFFFLFTNPPEHQGRGPLKLTQVCPADTCPLGLAESRWLMPQPG